MNTKVKKWAKRIISVFMATLLLSMIWIDGNVKAAIQAQNNVYYTVLAEAAGLSGTAVSEERMASEAEMISPENFEAGDTVKQTADNIYSALDSLKATDDSSSQTYYRNNGLDIVKEVGKSTLDGKITDGIGDFCTVAGNKLIATGNNMVSTSRDLTLSVSNMQQSIEGLTSKLGKEGSKGTQRRLNKLLEKQAGKAEDAASLAAKGDLYVSAGKLLSVVSIGLNVYGIYQEAQGLTDLQNEHSSLRALERGLHLANIGLATASIGMSAAVLLGVASAAALAPATAAVGVAALVVGLLSTVVSSEGFANLMNNTDNDALRFFDNLVSDLFQNIKTALGIGCYKPNIYIYGADEQTVQVIFRTPGLVVTSIPEYDYGEGWQVTAGDDGELTDASGETYNYLFYESVTERNLFETEEGFYLSASDRVSQWQEILSAYGFSEQEIGDFIAFWDEKLEKEDYVMYPQETAVVDRAMPVEITPEPENITRMWFVFVLYDGQEYEEPEVEPFARTGYTVVEWGSMMF